jgi:UDP-N-acetyl-D-galactosamine dehydrogenase
MKEKKSIAIIGLGYVGLPLSVALAKHFDVIGFDIDQNRIQELKDGYDRTAEIDDSTLKATSLHLTANESELKDKEVYIVTVPTPITPTNEPDLRPLESACQVLGKVISKGSVIVFESTVYPGVTEKICGPLLEKVSGLKHGQDFHLGYSPERINPGDKVHTVSKITKVVAGDQPWVTDLLADIYGTMNDGKIFKAASIMTAEAAKVIENAQRDINIAFINEVTSIFNKIGLSVYDVLAAAQTKWNFLPFEPGLVGGHCIGVDPYYLSHLSQQVGHEPQVILAGRSTNEGMSTFIVDQLMETWKESIPKRLLILGLTFKENVPDLRNTKVTDLIKAFKERGLTQLDVHDPHADPQEAKRFYGLDLLTSFENLTPYDAVICAVPHREYRDLSSDHVARFVTPKGWIADFKGIWRGLELPKQLNYWTL